jgi:hypothetical protein
VRRTAAACAGDIEAIRDRLIDDVALAERIKHHPVPFSGQIWLGLTMTTCSLRRQHGLSELWAMVARCAYTQLRHSLLRLSLAVLTMLALYLTPPLAIIGLPLHGEHAVAALGFAGWLCMTLAYWPTVRLYRLRSHWVFTLPLAAIFYTMMTIDSALQYWRGSGGRWKGRLAAPRVPRMRP